MRLLRLVAHDHEHLIESACQLLVTLAQLPVVRDAVACSALFADMLKQYGRYTGFTAAKTNGDVFCSTTPSPSRSTSLTAPGSHKSFKPTTSSSVTI